MIGMTPMVRTLLIVNVAITFLILILMNLMPGVGGQILALGEVSAHGVLHHYYFWQPFTYMFLHTDPFHLLFNMLFLWMLGVTFERMWGSRSFLKFIVLSGAGGGLAVVLVGALLPRFDAGTIGISGSINGLIMAFALLFPEQQLNFYGFLPIKGKHFVWIVVGIDVLFALAGSAASLATETAWRRWRRTFARGARTTR